MPYTREQWSRALDLAQNKIQEARPLLEAMENRIAVPKGLDSQKYEFQMTDAQVAATNRDFLDAVRAARDALVDGLKA